METETHRNTEIKLTLPDYKVSATIDNDEHFIFDNNDLPTDNALTTDNVDTIKEEEGEKKQQHCIENGVKETATVGDTKKHICPLCRKEFTSKLWFNKHMEKEHNGPKFECDYCQKSK